MEMRRLASWKVVIGGELQISVYWSVRAALASVEVRLGYGGRLSVRGCVCRDYYWTIRPSQMVEAKSKPKNLLVTVVFLVCGPPGWIVVYLPAWITRWQVAQQGWGWWLVAAGMIAIGLVPLGESIARFIYIGRGTLAPVVPTERLVVSGFYRYVRNPMYLGVLMLIAGQGVLFRSSALWEYLGVVAIGFHLFVLGYEEPTLRGKYGSDYDAFCRNVPRWVPRVRANMECW
jgi:protein-S-isoprenylcysteine O-methyltransferase Ste14